MCVLSFFFFSPWKSDYSGSVKPIISLLDNIKERVPFQKESKFDGPHLAHADDGNFYVTAYTYGLHINVFWERMEPDSQRPAVKGYAVQVSEQASGSVVSTKNIFSDTDEVQISDDSLQYSTEYCVQMAIISEKIAVSDATVRGGWSHCVTVTTPPCAFPLSLFPALNFSFSLLLSAAEKRDIVCPQIPPPRPSPPKTAPPPLPA